MLSASPSGLSRIRRHARNKHASHRLNDTIQTTSAVCALELHTRMVHLCKWPFAGSLHVRRRLPEQISINHRRFLWIFFCCSCCCFIRNRAEPKIIYCHSPKCNGQNGIGRGTRCNSTCDALAHQLCGSNNWKKSKNETIGFMSRLHQAHQYLHRT